MLPVSIALASEPTLHDDLFHSFQSQMKPTHQTAVRAPGCLTGLTMDLKHNWDIFSPAEQSDITHTLTPWKSDLRDVVAGTEPAGPGLPATDTCFGQQRQNRLTSDHFSVEWDSGVSNEAAQ